MAKIQLRPVTDSDLQVFFEHQCDPEAVKMASFSSRNYDQFMEHWKKILNNRKIIKKAIIADNMVAGNIVCFYHNQKQQVGYWIGKEYWGKGIATSALEVFLKEINIRPLYAYVAKHNVGSIRVLEKCGFKHLEEEKLQNPANNEMMEEIIYILHT